MSEQSSFFTAVAFTALDYQMTWIELVATVAGLLAVWLSARAHIANWGIGLINISLSFAIFYNAQLYADMFLQIYFFVTGVWGWWQWQRKDQHTQTHAVKIGFLTRRQQLILGFGLVVSTLILGWCISHLHQWLPTLFPQPAAFAYVDTLIMTMSIAGNFLLTLKKIESWILWVLVDIMAPIIYFQKNMLLFTLEYVLFLALAVFALLNWWRLYRHAPPQ